MATSAASGGGVRDLERGQRDWPLLLRPQALAGHAAEWAVAALGAALLGVLFVVTLVTPPQVMLGSLAVLPVLAAAWLLGARATLVVTVLGVALQAALAASGGASPVTAGADAFAILSIAVLSRVAAANVAQTRRQAARTALVSRVARIATSADTVDAILHSILAEMAREGLRGGCIALIDEERHLYITAAEGHLSEEVRRLRLPLGTGIMGTAAAEGRTLHVADLDNPGPVQPSHRAVGSNADIRSLVAVPLRSGGSVLGVLEVDSSVPRRFSAEDVATLEQIAVAVSSAVQRAGAQQIADATLRRRVTELAGLLETARRLSASLDVEVVLDETVRSLAALLAPEGERALLRVAILGVDAETAVPRVLAAQDAARLGEVEPEIGRHVGIDTAIGGGCAVAARAGELGAAAAAAERLGVASGAWAPVRSGSDLIGVLAVSSRAAEPLTAVELGILEGVANLAGLALGNAESLRLERARAEQHREHAERMAAVEQSKATFLRLASHELRGPLTVLRGYLSMIADGSISTAQTEVVMTTLRGKVDEMSELVDEMLDTARLEDGRVELHPRRLDLRTLVDVAVRGLDGLPGGGAERVAVEVPDDEVVVEADAARVLTILHNLLDNALKYSPGGEQVRCMLSVAGGRALVRVCDRGLGIAEADLPRLFTRFGRLVTAENSHIPGTGLGLYLTRELARLHGGDIEVESQAGEGSAFTLSLPLAPEPADAAPPSEPQRGARVR